MDSSKIRILDSGLPGPNLVIMGGVHGDEPCGVNAINEFNTIPLIGKITLIIAHLEAVEKNVRYIQSNLNRAFNSEKETKETKIAENLKPYLDEADALLDIHASTTKDSIPFCICEAHSLSIAKKLPAEIILTNIDRFHSGSTDEYMNKQGKVGICIECGYNKDEKSTILAKKAILFFCIAYGMFEGKEFVMDAPAIYRAESLYKSKNQFIPTKDFSDFEFVPQKTIIGYDGEESISFPKDMYVVFVRESKSGGESFLTLSLEN